MPNDIYFPGLPEHDNIKPHQYTILNNPVTGKPIKVKLSNILGDSLPDQSGHAGEVLTTDGSTVSWTTINEITVIDITYAALATLISINALIKGADYRITDRADGGIIVKALSVNQLALDAKGIFLNPDFQDIGNYSATPQLKGVNHRCWHISLEYAGLTDFNYTQATTAGNYTPGTHIGVNMITVSGSAVGVVADVTVDGFGKISNLIVTNFGTNYSVGDVLKPDLVLTIGELFSTITILPEGANGDIIFRNGFHYQITDYTAFNGDDPDMNPGAYTLLTKTTANVGYITEVDFITYDFAADVNPGEGILFRRDKRENKVRGWSSYWGDSNIDIFQWGNDNCQGNLVENFATVTNINQRGYFTGNTFLNYAQVTTTENHTTFIETNTFGTGEFYVNFESSGGLYSCSLFPSYVTNGFSDKTITFKSTDSYSNFTLFGNDSTFEATLDMTEGVDYEGSSETLTVPSEYKNYIGKITLTNNSTVPITVIVNAPKRVKYYAEIGSQYDFNFSSVASVTATKLVRDAGMGTLTVVGRNFGKDYLEFERDEHGSFNPNTVYISKLTIPSILS